MKEVRSGNIWCNQLKNIGIKIISFDALCTLGWWCFETCRNGWLMNRDKKSKDQIEGISEGIGSPTSNQVPLSLIIFSPRLTSSSRLFPFWFTNEQMVVNLEVSKWSDHNQRICYSEKDVRHLVRRCIIWQSVICLC